MPIPALTITQIITQIAASSIATDGIGLLVTNPPAGYTVASGNLIFNSLANAESALITEAKDFCFGSISKTFICAHLVLNCTFW